MPPVTLPPCIIFSFTGFQIFEPAGGLKAVPYFHVAGSNGPWLTAPAGGRAAAPLSWPAGAASGNCVAPGVAALPFAPGRRGLRLLGRERGDAEPDAQCDAESQVLHDRPPALDDVEGE